MENEIIPDNSGEIDLDTEIDKRNCMSCFYAMIREVSKYPNARNMDDSKIWEMVCAYSPATAKETHIRHHCGFYIECGLNTLGERLKKAYNQESEFANLRRY